MSFPEGSVHKLVLTALLGIGLGMASAQAEVVVSIRPPAAVVERRTLAPSRRHVWIAGYHRWDGRAYVWVPGRWEERPRAHAVWVRPRWVHRRHGWVFVEGRWR